MHASAIPIPQPVRRHGIVVPIGRDRLEGDLVVPEHARGVVLFADGASIRTSARNGFLATWMNDEARVATVVVDLLAPEERTGDASSEVSAKLRFDVSFLAERLLAIREWLARDARTRDLPVGYFGANTGAAAALLAAATRPDVAAIVARAGRPDLAGPDALARVKAATLLLVGENDETALDVNRAAAHHLRCEHTVAIVPRAGHLFEEPGTLLDVAGKAAVWFRTFLNGPAAEAASRPAP